MSLNIRPATAADAGLILAFIRELAEYERLLHEVDATEELIGSALFGEQPRAFCDIAEWSERGEDRPAGFALWFYSFSTFRGRCGLYLEDLYVRPAFRGRGIGRELLAHLAGRCAREGLTRLEWWVLDWNEPSIAFYKSLGAEMMVDWTRCRVSGAALERLAERAQ